MRITGFETFDLRFPTSRGLHGSDAMNPDPDYSAAYVILTTDTDEIGCGLTFTIGRGNDVVCAGIDALAPSVVGLDIDNAAGAMGALARRLVGDSQLRWIGPEKGVMHLATAAVLNATWDLVAKRAGMPVWQLLCAMSPSEIVELVDFRYLTDELTPAMALDLLESRRDGLDDRVAALQENGFAAYTTSAGWLGYDDETVRERCQEAMRAGFGAVKLKVGADIDADVARLELVRSVIGDDFSLMVDANQVWDVPEAIDAIRALQRFDLGWVEEPTSPDDVLGHAAIARAMSPTPIATGEMAQNRVVFKQLLQADAIGIAQPDSCRLASVNEFIAVLLLCAARDVPVCPHAGGVGLNEYIVHLAAFDQAAVAATPDGRIVEYVAHCSEHIVNPVVERGGRYLLPERAGYGAEFIGASVAEFRFPHGAAWR